MARVGRRRAEGPANGVWAMKSLGNRNWVGLALSGLMLAMLPACSATTPVASAGNVAPSGAKKAILLASSAQAAIQRADGLAAVRDAEAAVALAPDNAQHRALLGRAYLAAGRFQSADTAFGDALTLDPSLARIAVTRALTQIALGQKDAALASLDQARGAGSEADIGLALALAGNRGEGILRLEAATQAPGADARARQNLALAYALQGRWDDAATVAAADVPAEKIAERMQRWSQLAQRGDQPAIQIAMLLGIVPTADAGQPEILALAKPVTTDPFQMALAEPAPVAPALAPVEAAPEPVAPVQLAAAPVATEAAKVEALKAEPAPVQLAMTEPAPAPVAAPAPVIAAPLASDVIAPRATATVTPQIKMAAMRTIVAPRVSFVPVPVAAVAPVKAAPMFTALRAKVPPRVAILAAQRSAPKVQTAGFVVQLGAFSSAQRTEAAWSRINGKARYLTGYTPVGSGFRQGSATLYRLSISGLDTRDEAAKVCRRIKAGGGDCFVRAVANDRPIRWTLRKSDREAA